MNSRKQTIPLLIVAGAASVFFLAAFRPGTQRLSAARGEVQRLNGEISAQSARLECLNTINSELLDLRQRTARYAQRIPSEHALGEFLRDLSVILEKNGLENHIFQPRPAQPVEIERLPPTVDALARDIQVEPVLVQCEGRFEGLFSSLRDIEELPRLSQVDTLKIVADPARAGFVRIEMTVNVFFEAPSPVRRSAVSTAVRDTEGRP